MPKSFFAILSVLATLTITAPALAAPNTVHIVLKFVKADGVRGPAVSLDSASCLACIVRHDPAFERENRRETLLDLDVPKARYLELAFNAPKGGVRRVTLETSDLPFQTKGDRLMVQVPPLSTDAVDTGEFATQFVEPGMVVRFEHLDPECLGGDYAGKPAPLVQRRAADNLEFAEREAVRELGLGVYVAQEKIGVIEVMGFDTNYPHGHTDSPPHIHMHLRWPYNTGTQIGHIFIGPDGLLIENRVGVTGYKLPARTFARDQTFTTLDHQGRPVYAQTITAAGWLTLASVRPDAQAQTCLIRPDGQGFQSGAVVACTGHEPVPIHVADDLAEGVLKVWSGPILETLYYDRDTGRLISPSLAPPVPEASVVPTSQVILALPGAAAPLSKDTAPD
jgi:hypothetical protein